MPTSLSMGGRGVEISDIKCTRIKWMVPSTLT